MSDDMGVKSVVRRIQEDLYRQNLNQIHMEENRL